MPSATRKLNMGCDGCEGDGSCITRGELGAALRGFSEPSRDKVFDEFDRHLCGDGDRIRPNALVETLAEALLTGAPIGKDGLTELQRMCVKPIIMRARSKFPWLDVADLRQAATEQALKLVDLRIMRNFDIRKMTQKSEATTLAVYMTAAVAAAAEVEIAKTHGIIEARYRTPQGTRGRKYHDPSEQNVVRIDQIGVSLSRPPGSSGARAPAWEQQARLDGRRTEQDLDQDWSSDQIPPIDQHDIDVAARRLALLDIQQRAFMAVVDGVMAPVSDAQLRTALILKMAVEQNPALFREGPNGRLSGRKLAAAARVSNWTVFTRNHVLPFLRASIQANRQAASALRGLCDHLDGLDALYSRFPDEAPPLAREWSVRVFHAIDRAEVRALLAHT